jgi:hypothetical protein
MATSKSKSKPAKTARKSSRTAKRTAKGNLPTGPKPITASKTAATKAVSSKSPAASSKQSVVLKMLYEPKALQSPRSRRPRIGSSIPREGFSRASLRRSSGSISSPRS